jgi:tRNA pseudouridine38-40 synthase
MGREALDMRVVKLTLAYEGTGFVGWQKQAKGVSIQALVEHALEPFACERGLRLAGAGRTDAGVHALGQVASAHIVEGVSIEDLQRAINARLPSAVRVLSVDPVADTFHARYSATAKTYAYHIVQAPIVSPFDVRYAWHVPRPLDLPCMKQASVALVGAHDFAAFQATGSRVRDTRRTIFEADVAVARGGSEIIVSCRGDGFLRHMVRSIVGTLVEIGHGRFAPDRIATLLATPDRRGVGPTAPAHGLFLVAVDY